MSRPPGSILLLDGPVGSLDEYVEGGGGRALAAALQRSPGETIRTPDDRHDLPANVALVSIQGARADPSSTLVLEPAAQVRSEADPLGTGIASPFDVKDELVEGAFRVLLGGEAALALLASPAGDRVGADVDDELPGSART